MKRMQWLSTGVVVLGAVVVAFAVYWNFFMPKTASQPTGPGASQAASPASPTAAVPATATARPEKFRGAQALKDVETQLAMGPRTPGSPSHAKLIEWIQAEAQAAGWTVELQKGELMGHPYTNVIAKRGTGKPWIILGSHFDARMKADQDRDPAKRDQPVPAANDGAATTAVLLELARTLPENVPGEVWLAFFDAEDQGDLPGWDWILGSQALADSLEGKPDAVIVVDMIGDADLNIYQERNSNPELMDEIWGQAAKLGYGEQFIPQLKHSMIDDHTPFLKKGIPAVDLIDFDYPYWHTTEDTADKVSAKSMEIVGETLRQWLIHKRD